MAVVKKLQSRRPLREEAEAAPKKRETPEISKEAEVAEAMVAQKTKRRCYFCQNKTEPHYWDTTTLRKFISDRGRISPRTRSKACAKHQTRVAREIKHARLLALIPFSYGA